MLLKPKKISREFGVIFVLDRVKSITWCTNCKYWNWGEQTQRQCEYVFDIRNESILSKCVRLFDKHLPDKKFIPHNYSYIVKKEVRYVI